MIHGQEICFEFNSSLWTPVFPYQMERFFVYYLNLSSLNKIVAIAFNFIKSVTYFFI